MAPIPQPKTSSSLFELSDELPPRGTFVAACIDIKDVFGVERKKFQSEEIEKVDITAFLFGFRTKDGKPFKVATRAMRISGNEKSSLFTFLKSWLGQAPRYGWDYMEMKGKKALITIDHQASHAKPGVVYAAIAVISPVPEGFGETQVSTSTAPVPPPQNAAPSVEDAPDELPF